ncbi:uncharacterized protein ARMOST_01386 [Armillaria ostoyae]|uniref:Apple domain-containing protein n=1 Tax=Armillaria ostoyae TaxID=47428 RepID=A0A284QNU3_ARMOS|nr:uncharacterized protein ARMOST_01386 [Armillaria ostoyae]
MHFLSTVLTASCVFAPAFAASATWQYMEMFSNHTGAVRASDYQTYTLVDSVQECLNQCDAINGCLFVNVYHDVNSVYTGDQMTCAIYTDCHTLSEADNYGGQVQSDGTVDYITNSAGYCKRVCSCSS